MDAVHQLVVEVQPVEGRRPKGGCVPTRIQNDGRAGIGAVAIDPQQVAPPLKVVIGAFGGGPSWQGILADPFHEEQRKGPAVLSGIS